MRHRILGLVLALFAVTLAAAARAEEPRITKALPDTRSMIFIGNSFFYYNNSMHNVVLNFARAGDAANKDAYRATSVTISGSGMAWHDVASYFRPNALATYTFDENNNIIFNKNKGRLFDVALVMDCSQCPIHPQLAGLFQKETRKQAAIIRRNKTEPVLFMSWAYSDKPEMTEQLAEAYVKAANDNKLLVVPAGLAIARARKERPELTLYAADRRHPSPAGTYRAAATAYGAVFGKSPVGSSFRGTLDEATASFLQKVAADTLKDFYKRDGTAISKAAAAQQ